MSKQRMLEALKTDMMYADYRAGMSLPQVGKRWHYTHYAVWTRFHKRGFKMRSRHEGQLVRLISDRSAA